MQEEVENKTVNLAVRTGKVTVATLYRALRNYQLHKRNKPVKGKQTVRQLMKKGENVKTMDFDDSGIKEFEKTAKKYGLDFAIVKDKDSDPPLYTVFFKAKDDDVITRVMKDHTAEKFAGKKPEAEKKPSVLKKLKSFKEAVASKPKKEKVKRKEHER